MLQSAADAVKKCGVLLLSGWKFHTCTMTATRLFLSHFRPSRKGVMPGTSCSGFTIISTGATGADDACVITLLCSEWVVQRGRSAHRRSRVLQKVKLCAARRMLRPCMLLSEKCKLRLEIRAVESRKAKQKAERRKGQTDCDNRRTTTEHQPMAFRLEAIYNTACISWVCSPPIRYVSHLVHTAF